MKRSHRTRTKIRKYNSASLWRVGAGIRMELCKRSSQKAEDFTEIQI